VARGGPHPLVRAAVDEICAKYLVAIADERVVPVPLVDTEVLVEVVGDRVPGDVLPSHALLQTPDVFLWGARGVYERRVSRVQVGGVGNLVGAEGATHAGPLRVRAAPRR